MSHSSTFNPAFWVRNKHVQTIWGAFLKKMPKLPNVEKLRIEMEDGDFIDLELFNKTATEKVLLLHGLEGSSESHYIAGLTRSLLDKGFGVFVMHFRGCSGESNRLLTSYHSGISQDLDLVLKYLNKQHLEVDYCCGFSLGGNVLLKWLGEAQEQSTLKAAVAVSVPMLLGECAKSINQGFSKIYQKHLLDSLKQKTASKYPEIESVIKLSRDKLNQINNFEEFDDKVTAPLNGFESGEDYYAKCSSRQFLNKIRTPTLIIHAKDDPFMNEKVIPDRTELSSDV